MKKEEIKIGLKVRDYQLKNMGTAATITEITDKGFKYRVDNPYYSEIKPNEFMEVKEGEGFFMYLSEWEVVPHLKGK